MSLESEAIGKYAKLVTPVPFITWCSYRVTIKSAPGNFQIRTVNYEFESLQKDKDFTTALRPQPQNIITTCPTCGQIWFQPDPPPPPPPPSGTWTWPPTDPGPEPYPPPAEMNPTRLDTLLGVYMIQGMLQEGVPWTVVGESSTETGVTNSMGEIRINDVGPVTLTIEGTTVGQFVGSEKIRIDVSDLY